MIVVVGGVPGPTMVDKGNWGKVTTVKEVNFLPFFYR